MKTQDTTMLEQDEADTKTIGKWEAFRDACLAKYGPGCFAPENLHRLTAEERELLTAIEAASDRQCATA